MLLLVSLVAGVLGLQQPLRLPAWRDAQLSPRSQGKESVSIVQPISSLVKGVGVLVASGTAAFKLSPDRTTGDAVWASITTLTGAGFGDVAFISSYDRLVACCLACAGVGLLAQLASALCWRIVPYRRWQLLVSAHLLIGAIAISVADHMPWRDAIYLSVMTATGVGPGDVIPKTLPGRVATASFSIASSIVFASFVGAVAAVPLKRWRKRLLESYGNQLTPETLEELAGGREVKQFGLSDDGKTVSRDQFTLLALIKQQLISIDDINLARAKFDQLDRDKTGRLSQNDLDLIEMDKRAARDFFELDFKPRRAAV